ncbi:hypothetical protein EJ04DRAFT_442670 [Polyplosphaeria fusca]|uniref:Uncharacterized protein n=1 Tax=Polyplosphaeria fusca TaxID=682080 RepID=A0A9P4QV39_9PLEO|nr:hypothetical protein EJ04DRAFT_442670 [Polyplosphaeria fusca]
MSEHPVSRALAPWTTKSECYWMFVTLKSLPKGMYGEVERKGWDESGGEFKGGLGCVMVVRYRETPVGSYDELMIIPGNFTVPQPASRPPKIPKKALRIARIYVSQRTTTYNGRLNWNIPKHLARFSFSAPPTPAGSSPPESLTIKVFPPGTIDGDGRGPFFAATLQPFRWIPSIPVSTNWLPLSTTQVQPPLPQAPGFGNAVKEVVGGKKVDDYDINPKEEDSLLVGTNEWCAFPIQSYAPRARGCWVTIHEPGEDLEDAREYWQHVKPWNIGAWMEDAEMVIPAPLTWKL